MYNRLVYNMREIFPSVGNVTISPVAGSANIEIIVWPYVGCDNVAEATPLDKCGTGISQALAILFIASQEDEKVIVIDELNSFLHPMAVKRLIRILKTHYAHHQYIISTHYTDVIAWSDPDKVIITQNTDGACTAKNISIADVRDFELLARDLGLSMADVFGSDRIIWVEGETEEECLPLLMELLELEIPKGVNFSRILGTGNLSLRNRNVRLAFDLYSRVSQMASRLTRPCLFTMDRETMSDDDLEKLKHQAGNNLFVLNRRCYENYLISPRGIVELLTGLGEEAVTENAVREWLLAHGGDVAYDATRQWTNDLTAREWLIRVDGARLLAAAFNALTDARHEYRKTTHSAQLTRIIHDHNEGHLNELYAFVQDIHAKLNT